MPADPKIIDIISQKKEGPYVSLEYFPPRSAEGVQNLYARMDRMKTTLDPAFTDVTWGAGGSTADLSLDIALTAHNKGHVANLHMTCTNLGGSDTDPKTAVLQALKAAYDGGIRNIVALRGDPPAGQDDWTATEGGFTCALDLVKFIRTNFADDFGVSVAGYPEGHPNAISEIEDPSTLTESEALRCSNFDGITYACRDADYVKELAYLKEKVDAGADFIITQMFFDAAVFIQFVQDCRAIGITCPIVPGIMCITNYGGFAKMTKFCKTRVPESLRSKMESIQDEAETIKQFGMTFGAELCRAILPHTPVLHFYTLNLEKVVYGTLDELGVSTNALAAVNEADAATQQAKGSAWAREGDLVKTPMGEGKVVELDQKTGTAKIELTNAEAGQEPVVVLEKGQYEKA